MCQEYNKKLYKYDKIDQNHMGQIDHLRTIFKNRGNFI